MPLVSVAALARLELKIWRQDRSGSVEAGMSITTMVHLAAICFFRVLRTRKVYYLFASNFGYANSLESGVSCMQSRQHMLLCYLTSANSQGFSPQQ